MKHTTTNANKCILKTEPSFFPFITYIYSLEWWNKNGHFNEDLYNKFLKIRLNVNVVKNSSTINK